MIFNYTTYAVALSKLLCLPFDKLRTNGSMVLPILSLFVFSLAERKNEQQKEDKVPRSRSPIPASPTPAHAINHAPQPADLARRWLVGGCQAAHRRFSTGYWPQQQAV